MIEKLKGKRELIHHAPLRRDETDEQKAVRRASQTDLQNDQEDLELAQQDLNDKTLGKSAETDRFGGRKPGVEVSAGSPPVQYRSVTVTRESDRPGDIKTTEQRKKTVG